MNKESYVKLKCVELGDQFERQLLRPILPFLLDISLFIAHCLCCKHIGTYMMKEKQGNKLWNSWFAQCALPSFFPRENISSSSLPYNRIVIYATLTQPLRCNRTMDLFVEAEDTEGQGQDSKTATLYSVLAGKPDGSCPRDRLLSDFRLLVLSFTSPPLNHQPHQPHLPEQMMTTF